MIELYSDKKFTVGVFEAEDFDRFVKAFTACLLDKSEEDPEFVEDLSRKQQQVREDASGYWQEKLASLNSANFVLYKDGNVMGVGQAVFDEKKTHAVIGELHILQEYRKSLSTGRALRHLIDSAFDFLADQTAIQQVFAQIDNDNDASRKTAERYGLKPLTAETGDASVLFAGQIDRTMRHLVPITIPSL